MDTDWSKAIRAGLGDATEDVRDAVVLFRLIVGLSGRLRTAMDRQLADAGVTAQQAALLTIAGSAEPPATQGQLAEILGTSHQNVRQLANALERKGLLETHVDEQDRRVRRFTVTPAVAELFRDRDARDFTAVAQWFDGLDPEERSTAVRILEKLATSL